MTRVYRLLCGNFDCPSRQQLDDEDGLAPRRFLVDENDLPDGEVWLCDDCRALTEQQQPEV